MRSGLAEVHRSRPAPGRLGKVLRTLLALAVLGLAAPACSSFRASFATTKALVEAGYSVGPTDISSRDDDGWVVRVEKDTEDLSAAATEAARIVWRELSLRIDRLEVRCGNGFGGEGRFVAGRAELEQRFGPRDPDLDRRTQAEEEQLAALIVVGLLAGGLVLCAGIALLVVLLVRRSRRRKPPPGPWGPGGPGGPPAPPWPGGEVSQPPPPRYGPLP